MSCHWTAGAILALCLFPTTGGAEDADDLQARIEHAAELNVTAPWEESQAVLEELQSELDRATPRQRARVTFLQARNQALAGDYDRAIELLDPLRRDGIFPELRLSAYRLSANAAINRDRFEDAYRFLREGLDLIPEVDAVEPRTKLLSLAAYAYGSADESGRGIEYAEQAVGMAKDSGNARLQCVALAELSLALERDGQTAKALETRREGLDRCRVAGDPVYMGTSTVALGELLVSQGRIAEGLETIREGVSKTAEAGYRDGMLNGRLSLARALVEDGQLENAEGVLEPLVAQFEKLEFWRNLDEAHRLLARIAESRGEYADALEHYKAAENADDLLLDRERAMRVAYLQVEFDTRRKEQQLDLLQEQYRVLDLQQESQRQRRYLAFGGVAATTVIILLLLLLLARTRSDRRHLLWLSQHDGLTGLRNHSSFFRRANEALAVCRHTGQPFTLVVADIDFFKQINDEYGHDVGDRVLREIGELLSTVFWPQGIVGRIGGEEFGMVLPGMDRDQARDLIDEFNARLSPLTEEGAVIDLTLSYGIAETQDEITVERLRRFGDQALYEAKRRGRNCVVDAAEVTDEAAVKIPMNRRADDPA